MFQRKNIDPRVQKQLYRKIDSINRLELKTNRITGEDNANEPFFVGNALDVSTKRLCLIIILGLKWTLYLLLKPITASSCLVL